MEAIALEPDKAANHLLKHQNLWYGGPWSVATRVQWRRQVLLPVQHGRGGLVKNRLGCRMVNLRVSISKCSCQQRKLGKNCPRGP